jgi:NAD(P)-dependent dehydrogenase (short-subunit alcohol dehydrogenase family)
VFRSIRADLGEVDVLVYNAGSGVWGSVEDVTAGSFEAAWRVNALGALVVIDGIVDLRRRALTERSRVCPGPAGRHERRRRYIVVPPMSCRRITAAISNKPRS